MLAGGTAILAVFSRAGSPCHGQCIFSTQQICRCLLSDTPSTKTKLSKAFLMHEDHIAQPKGVLVLGSLAGKASRIVNIPLFCTSTMV